MCSMASVQVKGPLHRRARYSSKSLCGSLQKKNLNLYKLHEIGAGIAATMSPIIAKIGS